MWSTFCSWCYNATLNPCLPPPTVKILEKRHIIKENKVQYVKRERDLMSILEHPFFVKLYFTFQDDEKLCILASSRRVSVDTLFSPDMVAKRAANSFFLRPRFSR